MPGLSVECVLKGACAELTLRSQGAGPAENSITQSFLREFSESLHDLKRSESVVAVIISSAEPDFCSGMDFGEFCRDAGDAAALGQMSSAYMALLKQISGLDKVVIAKVEGRAAAGGVGIVAASDFVLASRKASFALPEVMWGLVPSNVTPFLIRRAGYQAAYSMALLARPLTAEEAYAKHLVDILSDDVEADLRGILARAKRLRPEFIARVKSYFSRMWFFDDEREVYAVDHLRCLLLDPQVRENITRFVHHREFPWQRPQLL